MCYTLIGCSWANQEYVLGLPERWHCNPFFYLAEHSIAHLTSFSNKQKATVCLTQVAFTWINYRFDLVELGRIGITHQT